MTPRESFYSFWMRTHPLSASHIRINQRVAYAVKTGRLTKPTICPRCQSTPPLPRDMHAHHADYSKPLQVDWMCRVCHAEEHRRARLASAP